MLKWLREFFSNGIPVKTDDGEFSSEYIAELKKNIKSAKGQLEYYEKQVEFHKNELAGLKIILNKIGIME